MTRRLIVALISAVLLAGAALLAPAANAAARVSSCSTPFDGIDSANRLVIGTLSDRSGYRSGAIEKPLDFTVAHIAGDVEAPSDDGTYYQRWANGTDGSLRHVMVLVHSEFPPAGPATFMNTTVPLGYSLKPRLFGFAGQLIAEYADVSSPGPQYMYRVSASGYLYRDTYHPVTFGKPGYFDHTVSLGRSLVNARTLVVHKRITLDGQLTDVLFATTKYGRLFEVTVPLDHPTRTKTTVLATSGFARYDNIVANEIGRCGTNSQYDHVLVGVDSHTQTAHFFALRTTHNPRPSDVLSGYWATLPKGLHSEY